MKKIALIMIVSALSGSAALAQCYHFINGRGPDRIGNAILSGKASLVCVKQVDRAFGGSYTQVVLSDNQGELARLAGEASQARCGNCLQNIVVINGTVNGSPAPIEGTQISIKTEVKGNLGISTGVLSVQAGRSLPEDFGISLKAN